MIRRAWVRTTTVCFYCGGVLMARLPALWQRCENDCASGLGTCPPHRLCAPRGSATDRGGRVECDAVAGVMRVDVRGCAP